MLISESNTPVNKSNILATELRDFKTVLMKIFGYTND